NSTGSTPNNYLFAGEQYDSALGLYYNRARYLDVRTGRFWGMDTYEGENGSPLSLHKYLYAAADPILWRDASGNTPLSDFSSQLNRYIVQFGLQAFVWTVTKLGQVAHAAIQLDVAYKYGSTNVVRWNVTTSTGFGDLLVDNGLYEIKPLGGTVPALPQLSRYLSSTEAMQN